MASSTSSQVLVTAWRIENLDHISVAWGEDVAIAVEWVIYSRLEGIVDSGGIVSRLAMGRYDVTLLAVAGRVDASDIQRCLSVPVRSSDIDQANLAAFHLDRVDVGGGICVCLSEISLPLQEDRAWVGSATFGRIREEAASLLAMRRGLVEAPCDADLWVRQYRDDMAAAVWFGEAVEVGRLVLAWQPIIGGEDPDDVFYQEAQLRILSDANAGSGGWFFGREPVQSGVRLAEALARIGLSGALDVWVLEQVIDTLVATPSLRLGCNISAQGAAVSAWWDGALAQLEAWPAVARRLVVEISEGVCGAVYSDIGRAVALADRLRAAGCTVAVDDFGAGRTVMRDVVALNPTIVKIDPAFLRWATVEGLREGALDELRNLIRLAQCRGREVVIQGIDTLEMLEIAVKVEPCWLQGDAVVGAKLACPFQLAEIGVADVESEGRECEGEEPLPLDPFLLGHEMNEFGADVAPVATRRGGSIGTVHADAPPAPLVLHEPQAAEGFIERPPYAAGGTARIVDSFDLPVFLDRPTAATAGALHKREMRMIRLGLGVGVLGSLMVWASVILVFRFFLNNNHMFTVGFGRI